MVAGEVAHVVKAVLIQSLLLVCLLLQASCSAIPPRTGHYQETGGYWLYGGVARRHLSRRLAAERVWLRNLEQSDAEPERSTAAAAAAGSYPAPSSAPVSAGGVPARVFVIKLPHNRTNSSYKTQESGARQLTDSIAGSTIITEEQTNSSVANQTTLTAPANQWYNDQVSGVSYFGRIPGSNTNQSLSGLYPLAADLPSTNVPNGCEDHTYPLAVQYPTVLFTVALQDYDGSGILGAAEEVAYSAAVNAFLAPTLGDVVSNTTFLHQEYNGPVLCIPSATVLLAGGDALRDFFQTTLDKDPNMVFPTAAWGQVRTSNIIYRAPEKQSELTFNWFASDYGNCSVLCGGGQQTRQVVCRDSRSNLAADSSCPQPPPATSRPCQTQPCEFSTPTDFTMVYGAWSACNSSCGISSRTRSASCVSREGYVGSLASCSTTLEAVAAQTWESCVLPPCPTYIWSYLDWVCHNPDGCGGGTATRSPGCVQADSNQAVNDTLCDPVALDNSTQPCAQAPCAVFYWKTRELADCLPEDPQKPCGRYVQRRRFDCVNMTSGEVEPFISCTRPKPDLGDVECQPTITCVLGPDGNYVPASSTTGGSIPSPITPTDSVDSQTAVDSSSGQQQLPGGTTSQPQVPAGTGAGPPPSSDGTDGSSDVPAKPSPSPAVPGESPGYQVSEGGGDSGSDNTSASPSPQPQVSPDVSPAPDNATDGQAGSSNNSTSSPDGPNTDGSRPDDVNNTSSGNGDSSGTGSSGTGGSGTGGSGTGGSGTGSSGTGSSGTGSGSSSGSSSGGTNGSGGSHTPTATPPLQPVNNDPVQQLGPGQAVPSWLFDNPTPNLQALLRCPYGRAVNPDGMCCPGPNLDFKGNCCDGAVDACGVCNGTGKSVDSLGACCSSTLDARGVCCDGFIDECGVCNGQNSCTLKTELQATLPAAALYLMPQSKIKQGLIDALQGRMLSALTAASGRLFDKSRLTITLSAYKPPVVASGSTVVGSAKSSSGGIPAAAQSVPDNTVKGPQQGDADPGQYSSSSTLLGGLKAPVTSHAASAGIEYNAAASAQPVFASINRPDGSTSTIASDGSSTGDGMQQPMQLDTVQAGSFQHRGQQGLLPASLMQYMPSPATAGSNPADKASTLNVVRMLSTSMAGLRHMLIADTSMIISDGSSTVLPAEPGVPAANSSNTIIIAAVLASGAQYTGLDSGTFIMALHQMVDAPMPVPGTQDVLVVNVIKSAERPTVCGDGICQAGERQAVDNSKSCSGDCGVPFLPCPPFNSSLPVCSGRGVCYHSIGSCSCSAGYAGEDCSMCATNYKMVNGFCVAAAFIAPPKANSVVCVDGICDQAQTIFSSGSERPNYSKQGYSSVGGIIGVVVAAGASMLLVAVGALIVSRRRQLYLMAKCREKLAHEAQAAQG